MKELELLRDIFEQVNLADYSIALYIRAKDMLEPEEDDELSPCCSAPIIYSDLCSACQEHI